MKIKSNDNQKIIFVIGVHNNDLVTSHCLAFNWDIDLTWLDHIVPCGIEGKGVTSLSKETNLPITIQMLSHTFLNNLKIFKFYIGE